MKNMFCSTHKAYWRGIRDSPQLQVPDIDIRKFLLCHSARIRTCSTSGSQNMHVGAQETATRNATGTFRGLQWSNLVAQRFSTRKLWSRNNGGGSNVPPV